MRKNSATITLGIVLLSLVAVFQFPPSGSARNDKRLPDAGVAKREGKPSKTKPKKTSGKENVIPTLGDLSVPKRSALSESQQAAADEQNDPDLPSKSFLSNLIDKKEYFRLRDEYIAQLRGIAPGQPVNPLLRAQAIVQMEQQEAALRGGAKAASTVHALSFPNWTELGPRPVSNGQTQQFPTTAAVTGRATSVVVDPTNSNNVYLGTAQGGVWRSTDGGTTWAPIFDSAQSLAVGALALAPSSPTTLYVGTGEGNNSCDSFFGVGIYRIDNASTTATLVGPINPSITTGSGGGTVTYNCFTGRTITKILVDPTNAATTFVSTAAGVSGVGCNQLGNLVPPNALRGVFRSTNATAAAGSVAFTKLIVNTDGSIDAPGTGNTSITDMAMEPGTPNNILVATSGIAGGGAIYRSTNALAATPTFTQTLLPGGGVNGLWMRLAINKVAAVVTVYVASSETSSTAACSAASQAGRVRKSTDGGQTWTTPLTAAEGYCGGQCTYDNPIGVDPNDANIVYLGGNARGTCSDVLKRSADGGTTFTRDDTGLHADSHAFYFDTLTSPTTVWFTNDGGVWKRQDAAAGTAWLNQNTAPLGTLQFQSLSVHPTDQNFTIGGTQDNGTESQQTTPGNWSSAESGDGGFALIDQSATDTTNVTMYHTFFNQRNNLIGFDRTNLGACLATKDSWEFRGAGGGTDATLSCDGTAFAATNGINLGNRVNFYAPMALGPGTPNILYFGTDRLYRSSDKGDTMNVVNTGASFSGTTPVSAIGIAKTSDAVRIVGLNTGLVFATITGTAGPSTMTDISPTLPEGANNSAGTTTKYISRAVIDPTNPNIAYITLSYYAPAGQGVFKTTNLNNTGTSAVTWSAAGSGIPSIPINAFVIDPAKPSRLFAGTDIGVYISENSGTSWSPYGLGLPRVAVLDMAIQPTSRILRVATHGRGMWEIPLFLPTAAPATIGGTVNATDGSPLPGVIMKLAGGRTGTTVTDSNGNYHFDNIDTDNFYTVTPTLANYQFTPANRAFSLLANKIDAVFTAVPDSVATANAIDLSEYFVRQQYLDVLGREPDQGGLAYWSEQINICGNDAACVRARRIDVTAAFFASDEFQQTGSYVYRLYRGALGRQLHFAEFSADRQQLVAGPNLESSKAALANAFVQRPEFLNSYQANTTADSFVDALLQRMLTAADTDLAGERANLVSKYNSGNSLNESRALVVRAAADNPVFATAVNNDSFVLMEYFGYLRRDPDQGGFDFWLNVLNNRVPGNYRSMVCAFVTSTEYQRRFSPVITRSNSECAQ